MKNLRRLTGAKEKLVTEGSGAPQRSESPERKKQRTWKVVVDAPGKEGPVLTLKAITGQHDNISGSGPLLTGSAKPKPYQLVLCTDEGRQLNDLDRASQDPEVAMALLYGLALPEDMKEVSKDCSLVFFGLSQHVVQVIRALFFCPYIIPVHLKLLLCEQHTQAAQHILMMYQLYTEELARTNALESQLKDAQENANDTRTACSNAINKAKVDAGRVKELEKELAADKLVVEKKASYNEGFDAVEIAYEKHVDGIFQDCKKLYADGVREAFKLGYVCYLDALAVGPEAP